MEGLDLTMIPSFATVETPNDDERAARPLAVFPRTAGKPAATVPAEQPAHAAQ